MRLEVVSRHPESPTTQTPLLFVHGAWHGAWCWSEHFLDYFVTRGYSVYALSLRGHGASDGRERLRWWRVADYVADIRQVVAGLPQPPVIIGHSMGGFVVQKYLETDPARAAVLLASVAPHGILVRFLRFVLRHPLAGLKVVLGLSPYQVVGTPALAREMLFSPDLSPATAEIYFRQLQKESFLAFVDMMLLNLGRPERVTTPVCVLGGSADQTILTPDVEATARAFRTTARLLPDISHDAMLDPRWQTAADAISAWLQEQAIP